MTKRDTLFLLEAGFSDPQYPGERFLCPDGAAIEGLLASDRARAARLDIIRVPFPKPRETVVAALDAEHQGVPLLILGDEQATPDDAKSLRGRRYVDDPNRILSLLAERHGFPKLH
ncbi:hypothetical protein WM40_09875 [Robbsia andropogonis]|uniref:DUF3088 domain-containing protein n=1 Tax=Robbsia andropogonis TaxID=28092 RepID=A0A0F5K0X6_9BURK|nr:DUF3088 domain-containing protein [Robbsia andropogonis]KKB63753.1 hypothetical protein WM40_09875 [Robbsia andropogonis]MCP1119366.1 DUF3088 domain-containing protein [Robbsia andropogonis]MCP1129207.1 DUF3088 domain-containing protein [Robbsia andropogonis]